jgi:DNA repair protein RadC
MAKTIDNQMTIFDREEIKYAYSLKTERIKEKDFPYQNEYLTCTRELVTFARKLEFSDIEKMVILYMNAQNQLICIYVVIGTVNQAVVFPRELFKHALLAAASACILIHNHPSGHINPSDADIRLTKTIQEGAKILDILVHDHLIIGENGKYFSFREEGLM